MAKKRKRTMGDGNLTVAEAGRRGGEATAAKHGVEFYERIGRAGGLKAKRLIEKGLRVEGKEAERGE